MLEDISNHIAVISTFVDRYKNYDDLTRCILMLDKLQVTLLGVKISLLADISNQKRLIDNNQSTSPEEKRRDLIQLEKEKESVEKAMSLISTELDFMENFVRRKCVSPDVNLGVVLSPN